MNNMTGERRKIRLFLSWARKDAKLKQKLLTLLGDELTNLDGFGFEWWEDSHLLIGEEWRRGILERLEGCDYGVLLVSPAYFASSFIVADELPHFVGPGATGRMLPVALKPVTLDGTRRLHGVEHRQVFREPGTNRAFSQVRDRDAFARHLADEIRRRLLSDAAA